MSEEATKTKRVCVTGAGGFIGSWLVKNLLERGYTVNATLRDPENVEKSGHLISLEGAKERLVLFKADLCEDGTFDAAVEGCEGVFHVATPRDFSKDPDEGFIKPTVKGVLNVLKASAKARCVRRVVYTSSVTAAMPLNDKGERGDSCLDESCWTPVDFIRNKQPILWMYFVSKTLAEQAAMKYGRENHLEVVSIVPGVVGGPCLTHTLPLTTRATICLMSGEEECYRMMKSLQLLVGCIPMVHVDDVCNAHIFLMEQPTVGGRYICSSDTVTILQMADFFRQRYPQYPIPFRFDDGDCVPHTTLVSSKKLLDIGFSYNYSLEQILEESTECAKEFGVLH